ncbi:class I SAM-dependent methyltransferase [Candidatus Babeliales bacterium]|nr:class I SAM-dependent methyltransferase [Candidatus Babeliales bacterium]
MLYTKYEDLYKKRKISTGFSWRLPDYSFKSWIDILQNTIFSMKNKKKFLDVGAGNGRFTRLLSEYFQQGVAIEVEPDNKEWQKIKRDMPNVTLYKGLLQEIMPQLIDRTVFDCIMLVEVFEHIPLSDIDNFVSSLYPLLADDGFIFLTTPNFVVQGPAEKSTMWYERFLYGHHKHYTVDELKMIFENHGFQIDTYSFEGHTYRNNKYNRPYFLLAGLDIKFLESKKIPLILRKIYQYCSVPFIFLLRVYFKILASICSTYEKNADKTNAVTIILKIKKAPLMHSI